MVWFFCSVLGLVCWIYVCGLLLSSWFVCVNSVLVCGVDLVRLNMLVCCVFWFEYRMVSVIVCFVWF